MLMRMSFSLLNHILSSVKDIYSTLKSLASSPTIVLAEKERVVVRHVLSECLIAADDLCSSSTKFVYFWR